MLKLYGAKWCPHCTRTAQFLQDSGIKFEYLEVEEQSPSVIAKIVEVNGGDDWVVPTLDFNGEWRPGQVFEPEKLEKDLKKMGVI